MQQCNTVYRRAHTHITVRIVDRVLDIAVVKIIHHLFHRHNGAVILRLFRGSAQMRDHDGMLHSRCLYVREVGYVAFNLSLLQGLGHIIIIYKQISCEVQDYHTLLHIRHRRLVDHLSRSVKKRNVERYVIALFIDCVGRHDVLHISGKHPGSIDGNKRIVSVNLHSK